MLWINGGRRGGSSRAGRAHPASQNVLQSAERAPRAASRAGRGPGPAFRYAIAIAMRPTKRTPFRAALDADGDYVLLAPFCVRELVDLCGCVYGCRWLRLQLTISDGDDRL